MNKQNNITGVVLAGGLARRMNKQDKGLVVYNNKPLVSYAIAAMDQVADTVFINANRNIKQYEAFGREVISDQTDTFDGPLAGILSAMQHAKTELLCVMPCDSPLMQAEQLNKLLSELKLQQAEIAVAFDGERIQPVFMALSTSLKSSLQDYLQQGNRKIDTWLLQHKLIKVDLSQTPEVFLNINTLFELEQLQQRKS